MVSGERVRDKAGLVLLMFYFVIIDGLRCGDGSLLWRENEKTSAPLCHKNVACSLLICFLDPVRLLGTITPVYSVSYTFLPWLGSAPLGPVLEAALTQPGTTIVIDDVDSVNSPFWER